MTGKYHGRKPLVLCLGEVLWDILPGGRMLGGAPANVAWHAVQLGAETHLASAVGRDDPGKEILARLRGMGVGVSAVAEVEGWPTGTVEARIGANGDAGYVIHEKVAWDFIPCSPILLDVARRADAVYFGSLACRSTGSRQTIFTALAAARPE
ncbi:MAG: PfkB family carbohydrate kinase, partial [Planctomycetota bacterium]|nr:PfkB family carbohydrate kinase [Planctomycetota bacterium]